MEVKRVEKKSRRKDLKILNQVNEFLFLMEVTFSSILEFWYYHALSCR